VELGDDSCAGALDFDGDFIGLDVGDGFVELDPLSLLFDEFGDGALVDGVCEEGQRDGLRCLGAKLQAKQKRRGAMRAVVVLRANICRAKRLDIDSILINI
jgi:hypothetical protein